MELLDEARKKVESAEVFQKTGNSMPVSFNAGELESVKHVETTGVALRVIDGGKLGFSTTTNLDGYSDVVEKAVETAKFGESAEFVFPEATKTNKVETFDSDVAGLTAKELIEYGEEVIAKLEEFDPDLEVNVDLTKSVGKRRIANSNGLDVEEEKTGLSLSLEVKKVGEDDIFTFHESRSAQKLDQFDLDKPAEKAIQKVKWAQRESGIESGTYPVILTPRGTLVLLVSLISGLNGQNVYQGTSPLKEDLGEEVFSENLTVEDYGGVEDSPSRRSFDDEGTPALRTKLISNGKLKSFLYDLKTAGQSGKKPTGNGVKGGLLGSSDFRSPPSISPTTLVISPGEKKIGKLISNIDKGLMVDQVLGLGQGNPLSGEFSNNVSVAYKIENGTITGKVKDTMIAGNVYELLGRKIELGKELEWVGSVLKAPAIALEDVNVVRKS
ncbi:MAG: TldD/PmbA family protein [Candidatus Bipolaricaulota bacterium]|nr:TldD/PmbA family protein [Candidatus Bipolaricaulota bacterium]MBS3791038.1 TldD/PmbA family protein [Candidatus Bipolaricaulota bacterium]